MGFGVQAPKHGQSSVQMKANEAEAASPRSVQLKRDLRGMDMASQQAALAPVQMKDARTGGMWTLAELGTDDKSKQGGAKDGGAAAKSAPSPIGPTPEQIVQDAYTLGGTSRYQVTPQEAMRWVEDHMRNARPEHKYAFHEAMKRINKRL